MDKKWLSSTGRRHRNIRDYIKVHGKILKEPISCRGTADDEKPPGNGAGNEVDECLKHWKQPTLNQFITNVKKRQHRHTTIPTTRQKRLPASLFSRGVRKKAATVSSSESSKSQADKKNGYHPNKVNDGQNKMCDPVQRALFQEITNIFRDDKYSIKQDCQKSRSGNGEDRSSDSMHRVELQGELTIRYDNHSIKEIDRSDVHSLHSREYKNSDHLHGQGETTIRGNQRSRHDYHKDVLLSKELSSLSETDLCKEEDTQKQSEDVLLCTVNSPGHCCDKDMDYINTDELSTDSMSLPGHCYGKDLDYINTDELSTDSMNSCYGKDLDYINTDELLAELSYCEKL